MKRKQTDEVPAARVYKNGNRWWLILEGGVRRSTGTTNLTIANRIAAMMAAFEDERTNRELVASALAGKLALLDLYDAFALGTLAALASDVRRGATPDPDIEPLVDQWHDKQLVGRGDNALAADTRADYVRQVRALVPEGIPFPCSHLTESKVQETLLALPISDSTKRRYVAAWKLFCRFVRRNIPGIADPFEFGADWLPANADARSTWWTHKQTLDVLDRMEGETRRAMALAFGTGMELVALLGLTYGDILGDRTLIAHGTKNGHRVDRTVIVDRWAWDIFKRDLAVGFPMQHVFTFSEIVLRSAFYNAQVDAGMIAAPKASGSRKKLWGDVPGLHTIHDARHTYAIVRHLGTDGEKQRSVKYVSHQLGHATEQMVMAVYAKAGVDQRRALQLEEIAMDTNSFQRDTREVSRR